MRAKSDAMLALLVGAARRRPKPKRPPQLRPCQEAECLLESVNQISGLLVLTSTRRRSTEHHLLLLAAVMMIDDRLTHDSCTYTK